MVKYLCYLLQDNVSERLCAFTAVGRLSLVVQRACMDQSSHHRLRMHLIFIHLAILRQIESHEERKLSFRNKYLERVIPLKVHCDCAVGLGWTSEHKNSLFCCVGTEDEPGKLIMRTSTAS